MYMKRIISLVLLSFVIVTFGFTQQLDLQPVAIVRLTTSEPITVKQLRTEVERVESQSGRPLNAAERRQVLDLMINERLALQAAARDRVAVTDNEVNQQLQMLRESMVQTLGRQPTDAEFAQAVRNETGLDLPAFREQLRKQLTIQKYLIEKNQANFAAIAEPTEQEIYNAYVLIRSQLVRPDTVRFSMIHVPFTDTASRTRARTLAEQISRDIGSNPSKFDEYVLRGQVQNAEYQAGDGGYLPRNLQAQQIFGNDFMTTAFSLRQGEVSRLMENPFGFQIIKITETYEQKNLELSDIYQLGTRMTVRDFIGGTILQERQEAAIERATQDLVDELRAGTPYQIIEANLNW